VPPRVHGHHQIRSPNPINPILFALCSPSLPLLATPFGSPPSPTLQLLVAHQFDPLFSYITHLAPRSHTLHTHTHAPLFTPPSRRYLFKPRLHLTSHPPRRTRLCCFFISTQPHHSAFLPPWVSPRNTTRRLLSINSLSTLGSLGSAKQHKLSVYRHRRLSCSLDRHHIDR
jgi:hypothetical protein